MGWAMKSVKERIVLDRADLRGHSYNIAPGLDRFWTDFWFHITLPVRAELAPTAVR